MTFHKIRQTAATLTADGREVRVGIECDACEFAGEMTPELAAQMISVICEASAFWKGPVPRLRKGELVQSIAPRSAQWRRRYGGKRIDLVLWFGRLRLAVEMPRAAFDGVVRDYPELGSDRPKHITIHCRSKQARRRSAGQA